MEKIVLIGASRGFGKALSQLLVKQGYEVIGLSRKDFDLSKPAQQQALLEKLLDWKPSRIFCVVGGGCHGSFARKEWKDHQWSLEVSFLFQAKLLHRVLHNNLKLKQLVFVGSSVAENNADPMASSYCAAKHALRGLVLSVQQEESMDLRLFSPGFMDTDMLPPNAWPRQQSDIQVSSPVKVAETFIQWVFDSKAKKHLTLL